MEIWKSLTILSVTILLILIGNKVIYQNNIAVLTGNIIIRGSDYYEQTIEYPNGFDANNSIVISNGLMVRSYSRI